MPASHLDGPATATLDVLGSLLDPFPLERFLSEHWGRRSLRVAGPAGKVDLPTSAELELVVMNEPADAEAPVVLRAAYCDPSGRQQLLFPQRGMARALYEAGMTLVWNGLEGCEPRLRSLTTGLKEQLAYPGTVGMEAFLSPDGKGAFGWHFDLCHVIVIQLEGNKRWQLEAEPGVRDPFFTVTPESYACPHRSRFLDRLGHEGGPPPADDSPRLVEELLEPGDVLYLPPGTWHRAYARGRSFALSATVRPLCFARVLRAALMWVASHHATWRRDLHLLGWREGEPPGPALLRFLADRLDDLRDALDELDPAALFAAHEQRMGSAAFRDLFGSATLLL